MRTPQPPAIARARRRGSHRRLSEQSAPARARSWRHAMDRTARGPRSHAPWSPRHAVQPRTNRPTCLPRARAARLRGTITVSRRRGRPMQRRLPIRRASTFCTRSRHRAPDALRLTPAKSPAQRDGAGARRLARGSERAARRRPRPVERDLASGLPPVDEPPRHPPSWTKYGPRSTLVR